MLIPLQVLRTVGHHIIALLDILHMITVASALLKELLPPTTSRRMVGLPTLINPHQDPVARLRETFQTGQISTALLTRLTFPRLLKGLRTFRTTQIRHTLNEEAVEAALEADTLLGLATVLTKANHIHSRPCRPLAHRLHKPVAAPISQISHGNLVLGLEGVTLQPASSKLPRARLPVQTVPLRTRHPHPVLDPALQTSLKVTNP
jgi:hypothetical protein